MMMMDDDDEYDDECVVDCECDDWRVVVECRPVTILLLKRFENSIKWSKII